MRNKLFVALLASTFVLSINGYADEEKLRNDFDIKAASMNSALKENNISFYKSNQLIMMKPNPKGKNDKPVPYTVTIRPNGDLGKPKLSKDLGKIGFVGTVAIDTVNNMMYYSKYNSSEKDYALFQRPLKKGKKQSDEQMRIEGTGTTRGTKSFLMTAGWNYKARGLTGFRNPSIANKGKRIYFTARLRSKDGNVGGTDIYYVDKLGDGTWTRPKNIGKGVNTSSKEDYAFCVGDTTLYYTSNGRHGMDVYKSKLVNGEWQKGENLGDAFNSSANDCNFIMRDDTTAFLISNRNRQGKDDVYLFRRKPAPIVVPAPIPVEPQPEPDPVVKLKKEWNFVLFYFDFDKHVLTDEFTSQFNELVQEMKQFPGETFEVAGHTDQRGSLKYNQKLSIRRAQFVKNLLIEEGFPANKIIIKGFGETMPVIDNPKSEEEFAQNRRCEIRIVSHEELNAGSGRRGVKKAESAPEEENAAEAPKATTKQDVKPATKPAATKETVKPAAKTTTTTKSTTAKKSSASAAKGDSLVIDPKKIKQNEKGVVQGFSVDESQYEDFVPETTAKKSSSVKKSSKKRK